MASSSLTARGEKMGDELLDEIEAYIDRASAGERDCLPYATGEKIGRTVDYSAGRNRYIGFLISLATRSYKGKKVGLDCANGSTWMMAKACLTLWARIPMLSPIIPTVSILTSTAALRTLSRCRNSCSIISSMSASAFDGDADRCLAVDEKGNITTRRPYSLCLRQIYARQRNTRREEDRHDR